MNVLCQPLIVALVYSCSCLIASSPSKPSISDLLGDDDSTDDTENFFNSNNPNCGTSVHYMTLEQYEEIMRTPRPNLSPDIATLQKYFPDGVRLFPIIESGNVEQARTLLNSPGVDLFYRDGFALVAAANQGSPEMIELVGRHPILYEYYKSKGHHRIRDAVIRTLNFQLLPAFEKLLSIFDYSGSVILSGMLSASKPSFLKVALTMALGKLDCNPAAIKFAAEDCRQSMEKILADPSLNELLTSRFIFCYLEAGRMPDEWSFASNFPALASIEKLFDEETTWMEGSALCFEKLGAMGMFRPIQSLISRAVEEPVLLDVIWDGLEMQCISELKLHPNLQNWFLMQIRAILIREFLTTIGGQDITTSILSKLNQLAFSSSS